MLEHATRVRHKNFLDHVRQAPVLRHKPPAPWRSEQKLTNEGNGGHHCNKTRQKKKNETRRTRPRLHASVVHKQTCCRECAKGKDSTQVTVDVGGWCRSVDTAHFVIVSNQHIEMIFGQRNTNLSLLLQSAD